MNLKNQAKLVACRVVLAALLFAMAAASAAAQTPPVGSTPDAKGAPAMQSVAHKAPKPMSIDEALEFTKKSPKETNAWLALGSAYRVAHRYDEAAAAFKKMSALDANKQSNAITMRAFSIADETPWGSVLRFQTGRDGARPLRLFRRALQYEIDLTLGGLLDLAYHRYAHADVLGRIEAG